jgi:hypothetical protein
LRERKALNAFNRFNKKWGKKNFNDVKNFCYLKTLLFALMEELFLYKKILPTLAALSF